MEYRLRLVVDFAWSLSQSPKRFLVTWLMTSRAFKYKHNKNTAEGNSGKNNYLNAANNVQ